MTGMEGIFYNMAQVITTSFITGLGSVMVSAKVYVQSVDFYASTLGFSIGQAAQIIVGQMMGAGQYEEGYRYMNRVWRYIVASNLFFTITMFLCSRQLMSLLRKTRRLSPSRGSYSSSTLLRLSDVPSTIPRVTDCAARGMSLSPCCSASHRSGFVRWALAISSPCSLGLASRGFIWASWRTSGYAAVPC